MGGDRPPHRDLLPTPYGAEGGVRPHWRHQMALLALAEDLGLAHLLTAWKLPDEAPSETPAEVSPPHSRSPPKNAARRQGGGHRQG